MGYWYCFQRFLDYFVIEVLIDINNLEKVGDYDFN